MKIIKVDECFQCKNCFQMENLKTNIKELICDETEKTIPSGFKIPKWCPLEDYHPG